MAYNSRGKTVCHSREGIASGTSSQFLNQEIERSHSICIEEAQREVGGGGREGGKERERGKEEGREDRKWGQL